MTYGSKRIAAQLLLTGTCSDNVVLLVGKQQQQIVANHRIVCLEHLDCRRVPRHHLDGDLQKAHELLAFEVDDEGRIQGYIKWWGRGLFRLLGLLGMVITVAHQEEGCCTASSQYEKGDDADDQPLLA